VFKQHVNYLLSVCNNKKETGLRLRSELHALWRLLFIWFSFYVDWAFPRFGYATIKSWRSSTRHTRFHKITLALSWPFHYFTLEEQWKLRNSKYTNFMFSQMNFTYFPCASTNFFSFTRSAWILTNLHHCKSTPMQKLVFTSRSLYVL